jgi:hypothetical protein
MSRHNRSVVRSTSGNARGVDRLGLLRSACENATPRVGPFEQLESRVMFAVIGHYMNSNFWGDDQRPLAPVTANPFPNHQLKVLRAGDVVETVPNIDFDWGTGSPNPAIRGDNHSTVFVGKLLAPATGTYEILGFGDDDTHVFVNGQFVSSDPLGHGQDDPRGAAAVGRGGGAATIDLVEGQKYDFVVMQAEQGGGSGVRLRWVLPGGDTLNPAVIPAANLFAENPAPDAPTGAARDTSVEARFVKIDFADNAESELRYELERSTDGNVWNVVAVGAINSTSLTDYTAAPSTAYTYRVVAVNYGGRSNSANLAVNIGAIPSQAGAQAYYFNDQWWKGGVPINTNGTGVTVGYAADYSQNNGDVNENWSTGEPIPGVIRGDQHSTVHTGKIRTPDEAGSYTLLAYTDDDSYFYVDGQLVSSDPGGHDFPIPVGGDASGFGSVTPITLAANTDYDFVVVQSEGGGGSGVILRWITPSMATTDLTASVNIPEEAYVSNQPGPLAAPTAVTRSINQSRFQGFTFVDNAKSELRYAVERATGAGAFQPIGIFPINGTAFGDPTAQPNTTYTYRVRAENFQGVSPWTSLTVTSLADDPVPLAPTGLTANLVGNRGYLNWTDNAVNETGYVVERKLAADPDTAYAAIPGSPAPGNAPNTTGAISFIDTDPALAAGQTYTYRISAVNAENERSTTITATTTPAGLRTTIYDYDLPFGTFNFYDNPGYPSTAAGNDPIVRVDPNINVVFDNLPGGGPDASVGGDLFAINWEGFLQIDTAGDYTFFGESDDGIRIFIDDKLVVDAWIPRGPTETSSAEAPPATPGNGPGGGTGGFGGPVTLTAGKHEIRVQFYEWGGGAMAAVRYEGPGIAKQIIPTSKLTPADSTSPLRAPIRVTGTADTVGSGITLLWTDTSAAETGFEILRRDGEEGAFEVVGRVPKDQSAYTDNKDIDPNVNTYYKVVALGAGGARQESAVSDPVFQAGAVGGAANFANFSNVDDQAMWTLNQAGAGGEAIFVDGKIQLTPALNDAVGSAWLNDPRDITGFTASFDFVLGGPGQQTDNPADGLVFVLQANNATAIGGGGGGMGYSGMNNSIGIKFDTYNGAANTGVFNQTGLYIVGQGFSDDPADGRNRDVPIELDFSSGVPMHVTLAYDQATRTLTQTIDDIGNPATAQFTTSYKIDIPAALGNSLNSALGSAYVGFTAATGGLNERHEILNFQFDPNPPTVSPVVSEVYVSGSTWATTFRDFVQSSGFGTSAYGYKLAATPTNADTVSWTNVNQIVLRYAGPIGAGGVPTAGSVLVDGVRTDYTVTGVETLDDRTVRLTLDRPLGNVSGGGIVGDRVTLTVPGAGANGGNFVQQVNVLQGDANRDTAGRVNANDQGYVKSRLNRSTTSPTSPTQSSYTIFADVDASGRVNSNDQGAVKSRLNDNMPAPAAAAGTFSAKRIAEEVLA